MSLPTFADVLESLRKLGISETELALYQTNYDFFQKNSHIIDENFHGWVGAANNVLYLDTSFKRLRETLLSLPHGERGYIEER